jgi:dienelactone hydrolase
VICVQGHSSGAHLSFGETRYPGDEASLAEDRDYAVQAVRHGYHAFVLEQRAFGERMDSRPPEQRGHYDYENPFTDERCRHQAMVALLLGRTLVGERVADVSRAIDLLQALPEVDSTRIACMGNSGGGTVSYYAACLDDRIAAVMPSCAVCSYESSIGRIDHCSDNYLPGALQYFDMPDLAGLIAPRPLVVVAGRRDPIFPYDGIRESVDTIRRIYRRWGPGEDKRIAFYTGEGGHRFYAEAWNSFRAVTGW